MFNNMIFHGGHGPLGPLSSPGDWVRFDVQPSETKQGQMVWNSVQVSAGWNSPGPTGITRDFYRSPQKMQADSEKNMDYTNGDQVIWSEKNARQGYVHLCTHIIWARGWHKFHDPRRKGWWNSRSHRRANWYASVENHSLKKSLHITQPKNATAPQVAKNVTGGSQPLGSRPGFGPVRTGDLSGDLVQPQNAGENATVDVDFKWTHTAWNLLIFWRLFFCSRVIFQKIRMDSKTILGFIAAGGLWP